MEAIRRIQTVQNGEVHLQLPKQYWGQVVEIIVLRKGTEFPITRHRPSPKLANQGAKLLGDDIAPAFAAEEWGELFEGGKDL